MAYGYNYKDIVEAEKMVEDFNITVELKQFHKPKYFEFRDMTDKLKHINEYLLDGGYHFYDYEKATLKLYKETTKKDMDKMIRLAKQSLLRQLHEFKELSLMHDDEVPQYKAR